MTELTNYQLGLIDGFICGLRPQQAITNKSRNSYSLKHDFESVLQANDVPGYVSQEEAEEMMKQHGFKCKGHLLNVNSDVRMEDTRMRLDRATHGIIPVLDRNGIVVTCLALNNDDEDRLANQF